MSLIELYPTNEFFCSTDPKKLCLGQLCWAPTPIPTAIPQILDVERASPEVHEKVKFMLRNANRPEDFRQKDRSLPIKYLNLRAHEELLVQRAKKRPVVIVGVGLDCFPQFDALLRQKGKIHLQEDSVFVAPIYTVCREEYGEGFIREMMPYIECLLFRQFFYIPKFNLFKEGVVRFDRLQIIIDQGPHALEPSEICLSQPVFNALRDMLTYCITGVCSDELTQLRVLLESTIVH
ncbi:MAG: hypothetical protein KKE73_08200 [Proteobacteria bacterium]|nr:hypothetical protein [Pseudomonadota bacterium]